MRRCKNGHFISFLESAGEFAEKNSQFYTICMFYIYMYVYDIIM